jgi:hypothetical protein
MNPNTIFIAIAGASIDDLDVHPRIFAPLRHDTAAGRWGSGTALLINSSRADV